MFILTYNAFDVIPVFSRVSVFRWCHLLLVHPDHLPSLMCHTCVQLSFPVLCVFIIPLSLPSVQVCRVSLCLSNLPFLSCILLVNLPACFLSLTLALRLLAPGDFVPLPEL